MNINDISKVAIDFVKIILNEENEWDDQIDLMYSTEPLNDSGFIITGSHVLEIKKIPVYVDDSNIIESFDEYVIWGEFKILVNDYTDSQQMYNSIKTELYDIVEKFNNNLRI